MWLSQSASGGWRQSACPCRGRLPRANHLTLVIRRASANRNLNDSFWESREAAAGRKQPVKGKAGIVRRAICERFPPGRRPDQGGVPGLIVGRRYLDDVTPNHIESPEPTQQPLRLERSDASDLRDARAMLFTTKRQTGRREVQSIGSVGRRVPSALSEDLITRGYATRFSQASALLPTGYVLSLHRRANIPRRSAPAASLLRRPR